jgi:hypothetical protein
MNCYKIIFDTLKGQNNFNKDLSKNHSHEDWACRYIINHGLAKRTKLVDSTDKINRKSFDMIVEEPSHMIEIKKDIQCFTYGNLYFETESREQWSGILTTKSDWWFQSFLCDDGKMRTGIAETEDVRQMIFLPGYRKMAGGDSYKGGKAAKGVLVPWQDYLSICFHTLEIDALDYIKEVGLFDEYNRRADDTKK